MMAGRGCEDATSFGVGINGSMSSIELAMTGTNKRRLKHFGVGILLKSGTNVTRAPGFGSTTLRRYTTTAQSFITHTLVRTSCVS